MTLTLTILALVVACREGPSSVCADRVDDADCDGVPDPGDRCPRTGSGELTDRLGCSETEAAGCTVRLVSPGAGERVSAPTQFRWEGTCEVYLLQLSDDPAFPPAGTRTALRTEGLAAVADGTERYWRVVGGLRGSSAGAASPGWEVRW